MNRSILMSEYTKEILCIIIDRLGTAYFFRRPILIYLFITQFIYV